jgi:hypothetical protein
MQSPTGIDIPNIDFQLDDYEYKLAVSAAAGMVFDLINSMWVEVMNGNSDRIAEMVAGTQVLAETGANGSGNDDLEMMAATTGIIVPKIANDYSLPQQAVLDDVRNAIEAMSQEWRTQFLLDTFDLVDGVDDAH